MLGEGNHRQEDLQQSMEIRWLFWLPSILFNAEGPHLPRKNGFTNINATRTLSSRRQINTRRPKFFKPKASGTADNNSSNA